MLEESQAEISALEAESDARLREALTLSAHFDGFKTLYDVYTLDLERGGAEAGMCATGASFAVEGWVPEVLVDDFKEELSEATAAVHVEARPPQDGDEPPTLLVNHKILVKPFESVTNNYSPPAYGELDPNPLMGFFFAVFFGIMLGDAGYGLVMAIGAIVLKFVLKAEKSFKRTLVMFAICGIFGIGFGLLFGGVFGISGVPALWFNPLEEPIMMLAFSLGLGAVQLLVGYTVKTVKTIRDACAPNLSHGARAKVVFDGIFHSLFMYTLFGGVVCFLLPMLIPDSDFPFTTVALVLLIVTIAGILLTAGRGAPKIGGKIAGGFAGLYGIVGVFSDVLSYSRLFGLALSGGAIAMAFNQIGSLLFGIPVVGYIFGGIILVALHAFNFALSALGAYVHTMRLQYVEFFGKFYDGDGRLFAPLGENTKYVIFGHYAQAKNKTK
jgi:V/A-type H+-transporting ATPase subunit I